MMKRPVAEPVEARPFESLRDRWLSLPESSGEAMKAANYKL